MLTAYMPILIACLVATGATPGPIPVVEHTPCGAEVWGTAGGMPCDGSPSTSTGSACQQQIEAEMAIYPLAVRIAGPTQQHNCHGFAFGTGRHVIMPRQGSTAGPLAPYTDSYCPDEANGTHLINAPSLESGEVSHSGQVSGPFLIIEHDIGLSILEHAWNYGDLGGFGLLQYSTAAKYSRATTCPAACP